MIIYIRGFATLISNWGLIYQSKTGTGYHCSQWICIEGPGQSWTVMKLGQCGKHFLYVFIWLNEVNLKSWLKWDFIQKSFYLNVLSFWHKTHASTIFQSRIVRNIDAHELLVFKQCCDALCKGITKMSSLSSSLLLNYCNIHQKQLQIQITTFKLLLISLLIKIEQFFPPFCLFYFISIFFSIN